MKAYIFKANEVPTIVEIGEDLKDLQAVVGGYIEAPFISKELSNANIQVLCNEDGLLQKLEPSVLIMKDGAQAGCLVGNVAFVGVDGCEFCGLNDMQIELLKSITLENCAKFKSKNGEFKYVSGIAI